MRWEELGFDSGRQAVMGGPDLRDLLPLSELVGKWIDSSAAQAI